MARLLSLVLALFVALSLAAQPHLDSERDLGRVERHVDIVYYAVEGETVAELTATMRERGPIHEGGRYFGKTAWTINAEYLWEGDTMGCRIERLVVRVAVEITLPRWNPPEDVPVELRAAWERFVRALAAHEHNHRRLAEEAAEAIRWELATMRVNDCRRADERARARVAAIIDEYSRRNRAYDRRTNHGTSEGAVWPPARRVGGGADAAR